MRLVFVPQYNSTKCSGIDVIVGETTPAVQQCVLCRLDLCIVYLDLDLLAFSAIFVQGESDKPTDAREATRQEGRPK